MHTWKGKRNKCETQCKISIIVPVYQAEKHIARCLNSLTKQDLDNYEIICVDDGSTDQSAAIIQKFRCKKNNIVYIYQSNKGVSFARNIGLKKAKGKYVMFVDADDCIKPYTLKYLYRIAEKKDADIVAFGGKIDQACSAPEWMRMAFYTRNKCYNKFSLSMLFQEPGSLPSVCNKLIASRCIKNNCFPERIHIAEDMTFLCTLFPSTTKIVFLSKRIYRYRISNEDSAMHNTKRRRMDYMENHVSAAEIIIERWREDRLINAETGEEVIGWLTAFLRSPYKLLEKNERRDFKSRVDDIYRILESKNMLLTPESKFEGKNSFYRWIKILSRDIDKYGLRGGLENIIYKLFFRR